MSRPALHPGIRIKSEVIPQGVSVTKAASLMGVGRPALSNLLNGKAALSPDMATRLERAFNVPKQKLLEMQAQYDASLASLNSRSVRAKAYVPPFLSLKANDFERWATNNIQARTRLSVLIRTLVHSSGRGLTRVDFPGNDDAEHPGWDGYVEADDGTPWVPAGRSGWEFGTNSDVKSKATQDFEKSVKMISGRERKEITFIFVTPRRWAAKATWIAAARAKRAWKDVRALDAQDLEQWVEQSLPGQVWFANETLSDAHHVRSLDKSWSDWANVSTPPLPGSLFSSAIDGARRVMASRLSQPVDQPTIIAADSTEEAIAFLAQLFSDREGDELGKYRDRVLVFDKPGVLPRLAEGGQNFIPVVLNRDVERELAPYAETMHSIVVYPRNAVPSKPHAILEPANHETFRNALEAMGKDRDEITRLENASGRSLTVLRRQMSAVAGVRTPEWAADRRAAASLVPFMFVGKWDSSNEADQLGLSLLAGDRPYSELERECQALTQINDAPIWSIGTYRGAVSKIDLLYAIAGSVTRDDLNRYFSMARIVLSEDDPSLDLAEDRRWAASIHGKTREFSNAFRKGISETLVLLAVHGVHLFKPHLGIDTQTEAAGVVRDLLPTPLTTRVLEANDSDLPTYAEAAPDEFLTIIERDLKSADPAVMGLLRPVDPTIFGHSPSRTGLLWALEGLAWSPVTLPRAALILARLSQVEINDNWVNKPFNSLESIFRSWMPQTAANHVERVGLLKSIAARFPDVAWRICIAQFGAHHQVGDYSHKPRTRPDGYGFGEPIPLRAPVVAFVREMVEMALAWGGHNLSTLSDLTERLHGLSDEHQAVVWSLIEQWAKSTASDDEKAAMKEKVRVSILSRRAAIRARKVSGIAKLSAAGKAAYDALEPSDMLNRHKWLFRDGWVEESADEIHDVEELDYRKRDERIQKLRVDALQEVLAKHNIPGLVQLALQGGAAWAIGALAAGFVLSPLELREMLGFSLEQIAADASEAHAYKNLVAGAIRSIQNDADRAVLLGDVGGHLTAGQQAQLFMLAPFRKCTWDLVEKAQPDVQSRYWSEVYPDWIHDAPKETTEAVENLLKAERPRAAFFCIRHKHSVVDDLVLFEVLSRIARGGREKSGEYQLEHYHLEEAFKRIDGSASLTLDQKAGLEFAFLDALARPWATGPEKHGIRNLERYIEAHPELFVQAVTWTYKRGDGGVDPPELALAPDRVSDMATRGYKLLESLSYIPGHDDLGELQADRLAKWVSVVRQSCAELGRADTGDICIGRLLSTSPIGQDGLWPCEAVRDVMEEVQSESLISGAHTGVYNSRGAHWRGEGGDQERQLADKYRNWAQALQFSHPFVASKLLMGMVETYEHEASREDTRAGIRRRLR